MTIEDQLFNISYEVDQSPFECDTEGSDETMKDIVHELVAESIAPIVELLAEDLDGVNFSFTINKKPNV